MEGGDEVVETDRERRKGTKAAALGHQGGGGEGGNLGSLPASKRRRAPRT
jgi:hypothetical protein